MYSAEYIEIAICNVSASCRNVEKLGGAGDEATEIIILYLIIKL